MKRDETAEELAISRQDQPPDRLMTDRNGEGFASLAGSWKGRVKIAEDFDELPDDLANALGMSP